MLRQPNFMLLLTVLTTLAAGTAAAGPPTNVASAERSKTDLRPVAPHLKNAPHGAVQYGFIAEQVQKLQHTVEAQDVKLAKLEQMNTVMLAALADVLPKEPRVVKDQPVVMRDSHLTARNSRLADQGF